MPTALLTATPLSSPAEELGRGALIAGRTLLQHQVEFALQAGCTRVLCLIEQPASASSPIQRLCLAGKADLHMHASWRELLPLIPPDERLLVVGADTLIRCAEIAHWMDEGSAIMTVAAAEAVPLGFERIDATRAWAGMMILPGALFQKLSELPHDIDASSALLRIALMDGTPMTPVAGTMRHEGRIVRLRTAAEVAQLDAQLKQDRHSVAHRHGLGEAVVERLAVRHGWTLLGTPALQRGWPLAAVSMGLATAALAMIDRPGAALPSLLLTHVLLHAWLTLRRFDVGPSTSVSQPRHVDFTLDALLILVLASALRLDGWAGLFAPIMLVGLLRLMRSLGDHRLRVAQDRIALMAVLVTAYYSGFLQIIVMLCSLVALAVCIYGTKRTKITTL